MIAAFTMNVSIDRRYVVANARQGAVNRVQECTYTAGGKGLNVSRVLHTLGQDVIAGGIAKINIYTDICTAAEKAMREGLDKGLIYQGMCAIKLQKVKEAAMESGKRRMRPIFLTTCTTALGVLPMILSKDALWMPMGVVICFGSLLSIILIVEIMPVCYWLIFRNEKPDTFMEELEK